MAEPLLAPAAGVPELISTPKQLAEMIAELKGGTGPIAIDAERASGYKYSARAYLIQIKRNGGGLHLIDPIAVGESKHWGELNETFKEEEWIIHASTQDLACLREVGIDPQIIFDTELAGRIAGCERVGLGPLTEQLLDVALAKEHSAVDWSIRPLRPEWLNYAALDVELLIELLFALSILFRYDARLLLLHV
jgi:ribonuclease D